MSQSTPVSADHNEPRRNKLLLALGAVVGTAAVVSAASRYLYGSHFVSTDNAYAAVEVLKGRNLEVAAVVISESPSPAPDFEETVADMGRLLPGTPLFAANRCEDWCADGLAGRLALA